MSKHKIICQQCGYTWESDTKTPEECPECYKNPFSKLEKEKVEKKSLSERISKIKRGEG